MKQTLKRIPLLPEIYRSMRAAKRGIQFRREFQQFQKLLETSSAEYARFPMTWADRWVCMGDRTDSLSIEPHYLYHPAWAARVLARTRPIKHVDISSTLSFCTTVSAFVPIDYYEWRPPKVVLSNFTAQRGDLLHLPFESNSIPSLSCMHTVEHVGLGRYGDPMNPDADIGAIEELKRVLAPGGSLLFVVPVGRVRIRFNANRVYSFAMIQSLFSDLNLQEHALILEDASGMIYHAPEQAYASQDEGCGCFWFIKPIAPLGPARQQTSGDTS